MKGDLSASPEINILKKINHSSIIRLSGFCVHDGNTYLVYEYAENGSLADWIVLEYAKTKSRTLPLTWKQRVQIAHDVADALNYLHSYTNPPYIHKNLKTSNILLDAGLRGKVTNFGLARMAAEDDDAAASHLTRHVVGTHGYMAPLDVFAFGVVLLELLSGKEAAAASAARGEELLFSSINRVLEGDNVRDKLRAFVDPWLTEDEYPLDLAFSLAQLAKGCVSRDLNARPGMPQILMTLSKILSSSLDWDPSHEDQTTSSASNSVSQGR
ncbi:Protein LYK5 [Linum grandiflorum]